MAHFLHPELVRQVNKLEWPKILFTVNWKLRMSYCKVFEGELLEVSSLTCLLEIFHKYIYFWNLRYLINEKKRNLITIHIKHLHIKCIHVILVQF